MELEQRVTRLEERTVAVERDIKEIKAQLNETAKSLTWSGFGEDAQ